LKKHTSKKNLTLLGFAPALAAIRKLSKNNTSSKIQNPLFYLVSRVRDSSGKPATGIACEDL